MRAWWSVRQGLGAGQMKFTMRSPCVHAFVKQDSCSFMLHVLFRFFVLSAVEGSNTRDLSFFLTTVRPVVFSCFSTRLKVQVTNAWNSLNRFSMSCVKWIHMSWFCMFSFIACFSFCLASPARRCGTWCRCNFGCKYGCYDAFHSCLIRLMFHLQSSFMKGHFLHIARDVLWVQYHFQASHNRKSWGGHCGIRIPGFGRHLDNEATWAHSPATLNHHTRSLIGSTLSLISF